MVCSIEFEEHREKKNHTVFDRFFIGLYNTGWHVYFYQALSTSFVTKRLTYSRTQNLQTRFHIGDYLHEKRAKETCKVKNLPQAETSI